MTRFRVLAAVAGAVVAGLSVATIAAAATSEGDGRPRAPAHSFGAGGFGPGCWQTYAGPFCVPYAYTFRLLAVQRGRSGRAWGVFERRNNATGGLFAGRVTCTTVVGNRAAIGGVLSATSTAFGGEPFVIWVEDNGTLGSPTPDQISALLVLPPGDPAWPLMPERFPRVCPSPDSLTGYLPLTSGDVTVESRAGGHDG